MLLSPSRPPQVQMKDRRRRRGKKARTRIPLADSMRSSCDQCIVVLPLRLVWWKRVSNDPPDICTAARRRAFGSLVSVFVQSKLSDFLASDFLAGKQMSNLGICLAPRDPGIPPPPVLPLLSPLVLFGDLLHTGLHPLSSVTCDIILPCPMLFVWMRVSIVRRRRKAQNCMM